MSDNFGFDFNNDGKVSFEESYLTYHIERETISNNKYSSSADTRSNSLHTGTGVPHSGGSTPHYTSNAVTNVKINKPQEDDNDFFKELKKIGIVVLLIIIGIVAIVLICQRIEKQIAYDKVIDRIERGEYFYAVCDLNNLSFTDLNKVYYKDLDLLKNYCQGMDCYSREDYIMATEYLLKCYGAKWTHDELRSPNDVLLEIEPLKNEQIAENHRRYEEEERIRQENWNKNGAPCVGMKESEITKTSIGRYSKTGGNYEGSKKCNLYYWFNSKGEQIYSVRCCEGKVIQVWDDRDDPRSFKVKSTKSYYNSSSKSSSNDDDYNVKDYYSAEDFYDDHYDDFFDYYDAEDYYEEHGGF